MKYQESKNNDVSIITNSDPFKDFLKNMGMSLNDFTCYNCTSKNKCSLAFDPSNINGICIAKKKH